MANEGIVFMKRMLRKEIEKAFVKVFTKETGGQVPPDLTNGLILLDTALDSLGFAILVVELEETLGFDPFTLSDEAFYPQTFGELVKFYEKNNP